MSAVDPFQEFVDELRALRRSVEHLARTSLSRQEAEALHEVVADAVEHMATAAEAAPKALRNALAADRAQIIRDARDASTQAAQSAVEGVAGKLEEQRRSYAQSVADARKAARKASLQSWPWIGGLLATGALLGTLTAYGTETAKSVFSAEQEARLFCGITVGQVIEQDDGASWCASWIVTPAQAELRRAREGG